ncbi:MAG: type IV secretion system protein [Alphaproteobacteria bacterium]
MRARTLAISFDRRTLAHMAFMLLLAAALFLALSLHAAHAQTPAPTPPAPIPAATPPATTTGGTGTIAGDTSKCKDYPGLTNRVAACIRLTLLDVTDTYFYGADGQGGFYGLVRDIFWAFITLTIVIYGVLIMGGMLEKISRDLMVLVLKIGIVVWAVTNLDTIYTWEMNMMDATSAAVITFIPQQGAPDGVTQVQNEKCIQDMENQAAVPTQGEPVIAPWLAMDCILDSVIGLKRDTDTTTSKKWWNDNLQGQGMARGLVAFFMTSAKTSVIGLIIGVVGFIFIYSLVFLIIKALFTYLGAYIGLTFLMIIAPLFIPLVLFRPTSEYFNKWMKMVISFMLQPVLMLIFITLTITAVDLATYSGDYSIMYKIAGDASRQQGFTLNQYLTDHNISLKKPTTFAEQVGGKTTPKTTQSTQAGIFSTSNSDCPPASSTAATGTGTGNTTTGGTGTGTGTTPAAKPEKGCGNTYPAAMVARFARLAEARRRAQPGGRDRGRRQDHR